MTSLRWYDFEVVHRAGITKLNADGLSRNPNPSDEDLIGAKWHENCDREAVLGWHVAIYLTLYLGVVFEVPIQGLDSEINRLQAIADIWEDFPVLHKLQHDIFLSFI